MISNNKIEKPCILEQFISDFNQYESEAKLFQLRDEDDFPWWDLARYTVQFELCENIYGRWNEPRHSIFGTIRSAIGQGFHFVRDITRIKTLNEMDLRCLVVSGRDINYINEQIDIEEKKNCSVLVANKSGAIAKSHTAISRQSINFFKRLTKRSQSVPPEIKQKAKEISKDIKKYFNTEKDVSNIINGKYREHLVARRVWTFILDSASNLDRIIYVNDDSLKTLVFLARKRGIITEELQHGYMGSSHFSFIYPPLDSELKTLPHKVIITRDSGDIVYPVEKVIVEKPSKSIKSGPRDIDVLVGGSPTLSDETKGIIEALVGNDLNLSVKLHPAQTVESSGIRKQFSADEIKIHEGREDFCTLVNRSKIFIPANPTSTTCFEAVENGAKLILVNFNAVKKTSIMDKIMTASVDSLEELPQAVITQLTEDVSKI